MHVWISYRKGRLLHAFVQQLLRERRSCSVQIQHRFWKLVACRAVHLAVLTFLPDKTYYRNYHYLHTTTFIGSVFLLCHGSVNSTRALQPAANSSKHAAPQAAQCGQSAQPQTMVPEITTSGIQQCRMASTPKRRTGRFESLGNVSMRNPFVCAACCQPAMFMGLEGLSQVLIALCKCSWCKRGRLLSSRRPAGQSKLAVRLARST